MELTTSMVGVLSVVSLVAAVLAALFAGYLIWLSRFAISTCL